MLRFLFLAIALLTFVTIAVTLVLSALAFLALACVVGIPLWLIARPHLEKYGITGNRQSAMERLKNLYVEGKIDLFEFERRAAHLLNVE
jgi:hypothetical protein